MKKSFQEYEPNITVQVARLTVEQAKSVGMDPVEDANCVVNIPVSQANALKITNRPK